MHSLAPQSHGVSTMANNNACEVSETELLNIKIKTLDSRLYFLQVNKQITVSELKEQVAMATDVPAQHQRILYTGRVLRDDHPLSYYNVQDGDTLHLVPRQLGQSSSQNLPNQPEPDSVSSAVETTFNIQLQGHGNLDHVNRFISALIANLSMNPSANARNGQEIPDVLTSLHHDVLRLRRLYDNNVAATPAPPSHSALSATPRQVVPAQQALASLLALTIPLLRTTTHRLDILSELIQNQSIDSNSLIQGIQIMGGTLGMQLRDVGPFLYRLGRMTTLLSRPTMQEAAVSSGPAVFPAHSGPIPSSVQQPQPHHPCQPGTSSGTTRDAGPSNSSSFVNNAGTSTQAPNASELTEDPNVERGSNRQRDPRSSPPPNSKRRRC